MPEYLRERSLTARDLLIYLPYGLLLAGDVALYLRNGEVSLFYLEFCCPYLRIQYRYLALERCPMFLELGERALIVGDVPLYLVELSLQRRTLLNARLREHSGREGGR